MYKIILITLFFFSTANAFWSACNDRPGALAPTRIESPSCSGNSCLIVRGELLQADTFATFTRVHNILTVRTTAYIFGIGINLPLAPPDDNACNSLYRGGVLVGCPTVPGQEHLWRINFFVPTTYPAFTNTRVRYELMEGGSVVACSFITSTLI